MGQDHDFEGNRQDGKVVSVRLEHGDCLSVMPMLAEQGVQVDAIVTDPPYHFGSIVRRFSKSGGGDRAARRVGAFSRHAKGFMGKVWDGGDIAMRPEVWSAAIDLLKPGGHLVAFGGTRTHHRVWCAIEDAGFEIRDTIMWCYGSGFPKSHDAGNGWGTALKPAWEPICLARKSLVGTVSANVQQHGTGAININACRVGSDVVGWGGARGGSDDETQSKGRNYRLSEGEPRPVEGRWPANVVHDGSEEVIACFPEQSGGGTPARRNSPKTAGIYGEFANGMEVMPGGIGGSSGNAARFFFSAKADADDRCDSKHPTVKPVSLMRWLARLVTPSGGTVLDPFAGSGTTGVACIREGFNTILIEREDEYVRDIRHRIDKLSGLDAPLFAR